MSKIIGDLLFKTDICVLRRSFGSLFFVFVELFFSSVSFGAVSLIDMFIQSNQLNPQNKFFQKIFNNYEFKNKKISPIKSNQNFQF
jgi:hypothetical protein